MKTNWQIKKLGEICDVLDNLRKPVTARDRKSGEFPYYGATGIQDYVDGYIFDEDLILVGEDGARWGSGDNTAFKISGKVWVNNHAHVIRPHRDILSDEWLIYFLNISDLSNYITGTTVKKLNQEKLRSIPVPLPPLETQKEIVAKLDEKFAKLKEVKNLREKALADTEKILSQTLREIFEEGKKKGWEETELQKIVEITSSKRIYKSDYVSEGVPFYRTKEISELDDQRNIKTELFISQEKFKEVRDKFGAPKVGDLLLTAIGTIGKMYVVQKDHKFYFKDGNILWLKNFNGIDSDLLKLILRFEIQKMKDLSAGSAYKALPIIKLKKLKISLPPLIEQQKIVAKIDTLSKKIKSFKELQASQLEDLKRLEKSYLREAFNRELI
ncbi:MAG: type restriction/modification system, subunit [Candidatus Parcubacteria bacterium]|jgi:type I restriction enzyme S subunit